MIARPSIRQTALVVVLSAATGSMFGGQHAAAGRRLPPLVLGNRPDRCDAEMPHHTDPHCPFCEECPPAQNDPPCDGCPYIVPPLSLPVQPRQPAAEPSTPTPVVEPPPKTKELQEPSLPLPDSEPEPEPKFSQPAEPHSVFSEEGARPFDALNTLLNKLQNRLRDATAGDPSSTTKTEPTPKPSTPEEKPEPAPETEPPLPDTAETAPSPEPKTAQSPSGGVSLPPAEPELMRPPTAMSIEQSETVSITTPNEKGPDSAKTNPIQDGSVAWIHQTAVDSPVDRVALADNLYAAGETTLALNVYTEIDLTSLDDVDRNWILFQLAGCYRRLGQIDEASTYYRKIVTIENPAWMVDIARWWLMVLDKRKSMIREADERDTTIKLLKEQIRDELEP